MVKCISYYRLFLVFFLSIFILAFNSAKTPPHEYYSVTEILELSKWKYDLKISEKDICLKGIIDGEIFETLFLDSILKNYKKSDFGAIEFIPIFQEDLMEHNENCRFVLNLHTKNSQDENQRNEILEEVRFVFNQSLPEIVIESFVCYKCPILIIDNHIIENPYLRKMKVNEIDFEDINFIYFTKQSLNPIYYGSSAGAGLVEIFTK
jgi:hypothetical protein